MPQNTIMWLLSTVVEKLMNSYIVFGARGIFQAYVVGMRGLAQTLREKAGIEAFGADADDCKLG